MTNEEILGETTIGGKEYEIVRREKVIPEGRELVLTPVQKKPITYITTYRGVQGFEKGIYHGATRDIMVAGAKIPGEEIGLINGVVYGGTLTVTKNDAKKVFDEAEDNLQDLLDRTDRMYVYLGKDGAGAGFEYVKRLMEKKGEIDITLVACGCDRRNKERFARENLLPIIWGECGGRGKLAEIVRQELKR